MTSAAYQTTPTLLPGTVTTDFPDGVESVSQAPQILQGEGDPTGTISASPGSFYTDTLTDTVYSNTTGAVGDWAVINGGSTSPLTTKGDLYGFSTLDARLGVGANGKVLTAKSSVALGVEWDDVPAPDLSSYITISDAQAAFVPKVLPRTGASSVQIDGGTFNCSQGGFNALHFAGDVATFTIGINQPLAGYTVRGGVDKAIAAVTWVFPGGATVAGTPPASLAAGDTFAYIYDDFNNQFWPIV